MVTKSVIVFDIDGTLTDSVAQHQRAFERALRTFPFAHLDTNWGRYRHHTDTGIFREAWEREALFGRPDFDLLERRFAEAYDEVVAGAPVGEIPGASSFVGHISDQWIAVFATGSMAHGARRKLSALGLDPGGLTLVTASEFETREELVEHAVRRGCARHGVDAPDRVVSIGDGVWDLKTARALGYEFVGIGGCANARTLVELGATVHGDFHALMNARGAEFASPVSRRPS